MSQETIRNDSCRPSNCQAVFDDPADVEEIAACEKMLRHRWTAMRTPFKEEDVRITARKMVAEERLSARMKAQLESLDDEDEIDEAWEQHQQERKAKTQGESYALDDTYKSPSGTTPPTNQRLSTK